MTTNTVRACARKITEFYERFASAFGRKEARRHALVYLKKLLLAHGRKNVERIALRFATASDGRPASQKEVVALQEFLTLSPWQAAEVQRKVQLTFAEEIVPSTAWWSIGTVGVVDESAFVKSGPESCGVKRQWCGRLGKKENCQVGVFLIGVTLAGSALLEHQLYLPQEWAEDAVRRQKTRVPGEVRFQTKPEIATDHTGPPGSGFAACGPMVTSASIGSPPTNSTAATATFWMPWKRTARITWWRCRSTPWSGPKTGHATAGVVRPRPPAEEPATRQRPKR